MGSIDAACIAGFLCRLCSEMHRTVIHIYSDQGQKHGLPGKINAYLPVTITPNDPLPKTICKTCMQRVEQHHELMVKIQKHRVLNSMSQPTEKPRVNDVPSSTLQSHESGSQGSQEKKLNTNGSESIRASDVLAIPSTSTSIRIIRGSSDDAVVDGSQCDNDNRNIETNLPESVNQVVQINCETERSDRNINNSTRRVHE